MLKPDSMLTSDERRRAIAAILARGIRRLLEGCAAVTDHEEDASPPAPREDAKGLVSGSAS